MEPCNATEKVLGVVWDSMKDNFHFKVKLSFSLKIKTARTQKDATPTDVEATCNIPVQFCLK